MYQIVKGLFAVILTCGISSAQLDVDFSLTPTDNGIKFAATLYGQQEVLTGVLNVGKDMSSVQCLNSSECEIGDSLLRTEDTNTGLKISWQTPNKSTEFLDCFDLQEGVFWYGGPQRRVQTWPLNEMVINGSLPYVSRRHDNFAVAERYWLNSFGAFIYVVDYVPLFVDQNSAYENRICFGARLDEPYLQRDRNILEYYIGVDFDQDARGGQWQAVNNYMDKRIGHPEEAMFSEPIWSTSAKYKKNLSDSALSAFAKAIKHNGYAGQIDIDDSWETCYGALEFDEERFIDISSTVADLKDMDFRVNLWVHPFVSSDCKEITEEGLAKGYFVVNGNNETRATWWNGEDARLIDFTNPKAVKWWSKRVRNLLEENNIDSIKCDAGETDYVSQDSVYESVDPETAPNIFTSSYIRACAEFGYMVEVASASKTQDLTLFLRMAKRESTWGFDNGLSSVITNLLQLNMNGYPMVLPDVIGGSGQEPPSAELLVRWTQANTFMPAMQFGYLPWEITTSEFVASAIVKKFVYMHKKNVDAIMDAMARNREDGLPVNRPIWWIDPSDQIALACNDEFLLGSDILVAPILEEGATSRKVYLPTGSWQDGNNYTIYQGPTTLDYAADISTLPYFTLMDESDRKK